MQLASQMAHNPLSQYFAHEHSNTLVCTSAGVIGGVTKAFTTPHLLNITFDGSLTVAGYAALSSIAAYFAKEAIAWLHQKFLRFAGKDKQTQEQEGGSENE